jgi:hypothetical protein
MDLVRKFPRQKVPLLRQFHYFSIFEIDLNRNISTGQCCGSAFDLSPSCGSGCRLLFDADADQTFHLDLGCHHQIDADPDLFLDQAYHFDAGPDADPDFFNADADPG